MGSLVSVPSITSTPAPTPAPSPASSPGKEKKEKPGKEKSGIAPKVPKVTAKPPIPKREAERKKGKVLLYQIIVTLKSNLTQ